MKKKALISVVSNQNYEDDDVIEVVTPGEFLINEDAPYEAVYKETEISGMEGTTTKVKIYRDEIFLVREGTTSTRMEFKKNKNYVTLYNTPYGMLELKINTKDLKVDVDEKGGEVEIDYNISISGQPTQETQLKIKIKA